ncbi:MAG: hypothetical protein DIU62_006220 [Pseudomonadota bacterium]
MNGTGISGTNATAHSPKFQLNLGPTSAVADVPAEMARRRWQFIIIGLLRSGSDPEELAKQGKLF